MLVTAVVGSYRKGNTYNVVRQIAERLQEHGAEVRYLFLTDVNLQQCKGCYTCLRRGEGLCPLKDDLPAIEQQFIDSDGVIFASPNYACGVSALMRGLIERFAYIGHRPRFFGRHMVAVSTSGGPVGLKKALDDLCYFAGGGFVVSGRLGLMTPPSTESPKAREKKDRKIIACADKLYRDMQQKPVPRPSYGAMMQFAAFRGMYRGNPALGESMFPADMKYWREQGWLNRGARYYCRAKIDMFKRAFSVLFQAILGRAAKGMK